MADIQKHSETNEKTSPKQGSLSDRLNEEAYQTMHSASVSHDQAWTKVDKSFSKAESSMSATSEESKSIKFDHALWADAYGYSHNNQGAKDRAVEILKSIPGGEANPNVAGALIQSKDGAPIDRLNGKASAIAFEKAAEDSLKATDKNVGGFLGKIFFDLQENSLEQVAPRASKQLAAALESNETAAMSRWGKFDKDHKYDSVLSAARILRDENKSHTQTANNENTDQHSPDNERAKGQQPAKGEGDKDGVLYLKGALSSALHDFDKNGDNELSKDELQTAAIEYNKQGDTRKAAALQFGIENFDNLRRLSGAGDGIFASHQGISRSDISELPNYQSYLSSGNWSGSNPLYSEAMKNRAKAIGTTLGTLAEGASFLTGVGEAITAYSALSGAATGGAIGGGYGAYLDFSDPY
ncbi:MAG: hypothetical protein K2X81_16800, partial [Candidatus Obscuribacterales bacterium]|nr:hypothetical protein [Candidatus Obscuribacterales bacterium]